jgi:hypothetical protein
VVEQLEPRRLLSALLVAESFGGKGFRAITSDVQPGFPTYRTEQM